MTRISNNKWGIFGQDLSQRLSDIGEVLDEVAIKSRMTNETLHPFDKSRMGQSLNDLNLSLVHLDPPINNDMIQN